MNRYRLLLITMLSLGAIFIMPATSQAQCIERCVLVRDGDNGGTPIGHGCISGNEGNGCVATVYECNINRTGCGGDMLLESPVLDEDGQQLATAKVCAAAKQIISLASMSQSDGSRAASFRSAQSRVSERRADDASRF